LCPRQDLLPYLSKDDATTTNLYDLKHVVYMDVVVGDE